MSRTRFALAAWAALPSLFAVVALRAAPAVAAPQFFYLTGVAAADNSGGNLGPGGGLVTLDSGGTQVSARLDDNPSASVLASPVEPGTFARTVFGQANGSAGRELLSVPQAQAGYPGPHPSQRLAPLPGAAAGPLSITPAGASADATATSADGWAATGSTSAAGLFSLGSADSSVRLSDHPGNLPLAGFGSAQVSGLDVAGVLRIATVTATASVSDRAGRHVASAHTLVSDASVDGQPVSIGPDGVRAASDQLVPGSLLRETTAEVDGLLAAAGLRVALVAPVHAVSAHTAYADSGGVTISVTLPEPSPQLGQTDLTVTVGTVLLTEADVAATSTPPLPPFAGGAPVPARGHPAAAPAPGSGPSVRVIPGTPALPGSASTGGAAPRVVATRPAALVLLGHRLSPTAALAGFAAWQFLTLGVATLALLAARPRDEEAQRLTSCPCPAPVPGG